MAGVRLQVNTLVAASGQTGRASQDAFPLIACLSRGTLLITGPTMIHIFLGVDTLRTTVAQALGANVFAYAIVTELIGSAWNIAGTTMIPVDFYVDTYATTKDLP